MALGVVTPCLYGPMARQRFAVFAFELGACVLFPLPLCYLPGPPNSDVPSITSTREMMVGQTPLPIRLTGGILRECGSDMVAGSMTA